MKPNLKIVSSISGYVVIFSKALATIPLESLKAVPPEESF